MNQPDIQRTAAVVTLLQVPQEERDEAWRGAFFDAIPDAALVANDPQLLHGPDGFPYAALRTPRPDEEFVPYSVNMVLEQVTDTGVGLVLNPAEDSADWVFSYGDLLELRMRGELRIHAPGSGHSETVLPENEQVMVGEPSETYLPVYARLVLADHLQRLGVAHPSAVLMYRPSEGGNSLVFPFTPEQFGSEDALRTVLGSITWFLPRHYRIGAMTARGMKFVPLDPSAPPPPAPPEKPAGEAPSAAPSAVPPTAPPRTAKPRSNDPKQKPWYRRLF